MRKPRFTYEPNRGFFWDMMVAVHGGFHAIRIGPYDTLDRAWVARSPPKPPDAPRLEPDSKEWPPEHVQTETKPRRFRWSHLGIWPAMALWPLLGAAELAYDHWPAAWALVIAGATAAVVIDWLRLRAMRDAESPRQALS